MHEYKTKELLSKGISKDGQQETNKRLDRIEKKLDSVHEQTAHTIEKTDKIN